MTRGSVILAGLREGLVGPRRVEEAAGRHRNEVGEAAERLVVKRVGVRPLLDEGVAVQRVVERLFRGVLLRLVGLHAVDHVVLGADELIDEIGLLQALEDLDSLERVAPGLVLGARALHLKRISHAVEAAPQGADLGRDDLDVLDAREEASELGVKIADGDG